ncbi:hypothetical protein RM780_07805 [Streptomyces sp. DSM 44917]|uniref:Uncharacterized protein n=1 Tax=Streptomyces boetiae TaxID=3075541 RepID=A0ABU2L5U4_9ACTN|nr:hypothetical protein [Streptomyces sp. DSM 44917]MDT0306867.1 hypothetical protein [Streptomyces sp. DSM 44917]
MSDERMVAALLRERAGYLRRGDEDRVAQVDAQLRHYGHNPGPEPGPDPDAPGGPAGRQAPPQETTTAPPQDTVTAQGDAPDGIPGEQEQPKRRGRPRKPRDAEGNIIRE